MLRDSTTSLTVLDQVGRIHDWANLGTLLGMSLHDGKQRDPLEFYKALVNYVSNLMKQNGNYVLHDFLMFSICSLNSLSTVHYQKVLLKKPRRVKLSFFLQSFMCHYNSCCGICYS